MPEIILLNKISSDNKILMSFWRVKVSPVLFWMFTMFVCLCCVFSTLVTSQIQGFDLDALTSGDFDTTNPNVIGMSKCIHVVLYLTVTCCYFLKFYYQKLFQKQLMKFGITFKPSASSECDYVVWCICKCICGSSWKVWNCLCMIFQKKYIWFFYDAISLSNKDY